jgi:hypothetical protein
VAGNKKSLMETITKHNPGPKLSNQSLIQDAFQVLLEHLGPKKTMQLWHLFFPPQEDYVKTRHNLFAGKCIGQQFFGHLRP